MCDEKNIVLPLCGELLYGFPELDDALGIEAVRRLVQEEYLGVVEEGLREAQALLHAAGVGARGLFDLSRPTYASNSEMRLSASASFMP